MRAIPTSLKPMTPFQRGWVAAYIEAEGSITGGHIDIWANDRTMLERFQAYTGVGSIYTVTLTNRRRKYGTRSESNRLLVQRKNDVRALLRTIYKHLGEAKQERAREILERQ